MVVITEQEWNLIQLTFQQAANLKATVDNLAKEITEMKSMKEELAQCISQCNQMASSEPETPIGNLWTKLDMLEQDFQWIQERVVTILSR